MLKGFGVRLTQIRRSCGLTQTELGRMAGVSQRVIAYYEQDNAQPPGALLVDLARALRISTDELLGLKPLRETATPRAARLLRRLQRVQALPPADQRAVLKVLDAFLASRREKPADGERRSRA